MTVREKVNSNYYGLMDIDKFKEDVLNEYDLRDNPRGHRAFEVAWERGCTLGYSGVLDLFEDLMMLIVVLEEDSGDEA